ncbi:MAG TPA: PKD domain-containing protein [Bacteroidales bacterium]|nr:PKD domain-containing protein [Bacteroidales bacterium]
MPLPQGVIKFRVESNRVTFELTSTNTESFEWNFGDGDSVSTEMNPIHVYSDFGKTYTVNLVLKGPGGQTILTEDVTIPEMTGMEMLTGGENCPDGKSWQLSATAELYEAKPGASMTIVKTFKASSFSESGFSGIVSDRFIFKNNGSFIIHPSGSTITAGLQYCLSRNIINSIPAQASPNSGLTCASYNIPAGLTFGYNESKDYKTDVITDGTTPQEITIPDVPTISFSKGGFLGILDWSRECVILDLNEDYLKIALFLSDIPATSNLAGYSTKVYILTFGPAE